MDKRIVPFEIRKIYWKFEVNNHLMNTIGKNQLSLYVLELLGHRWWWLQSSRNDWGDGKAYGVDVKLFD
jgi:hypothetical protein